MESETRKHKNFIGYEYKEIEADPGQVSFLKRIPREKGESVFRCSLARVGISLDLSGSSPGISAGHIASVSQTGDRNGWCSHTRFSSR